MVVRGFKAMPVNDVAAGAAVEEVVVDSGVKAMPVNDDDVDGGAAVDELLGELLEEELTARR